MAGLSRSDEEWRRNAYFIHIHSAITGFTTTLAVAGGAPRTSLNSSWVKGGRYTWTPAIVRAECRAAWNPSHAIEHRDVSATSRCVYRFPWRSPRLQGFPAPVIYFAIITTPGVHTRYRWLLNVPRSSAFSLFVLFFSGHSKAAQFWIVTRRL